MADKQSQNLNATTAAREYVMKQLQIMKQLGSAPKLSAEKFEAIVREVAQAK